jgi:hypothetical protein
MVTLKKLPIINDVQKLPHIIMIKYGRPNKDWATECLKTTFRWDFEALVERIKEDVLTKYKNSVTVFSMKDSIVLTEMPVNYTGGHDRLEVMSFDSDIHDRAGVYLQHVEGCGYTVYNLTPQQAIELASILIRQANDSLEQFAAKTAEY